MTVSEGSEMDGFEAVKEIAKACDGTITEVGILPDNSGFAVMSMPLREDHWIYGDRTVENKVCDEPECWHEPPPMVFKVGTEQRAMIVIDDGPTDPNDAGFEIAHGVTMTRQGFAERIRRAGRYAIRAATMKGKEMDFDPDALLQNLVVGFLGYWTEDGLTKSDEWANPTTSKP